MESSRKPSSPISKASAAHGLVTLILITAAILLFNFSDSHHTAAISTLLVSRHHSASTYFSSSLSSIKTEEPAGEEDDDISSCNLFDGRWVAGESDSLYEPGSCPFIDDSFNCFKNGRPDSDYTRLKWKPSRCQIPRFDGLKMLKMLSGKRVVFVGDSLNRNMWESLICSLRESMANKSRVAEFKTQGYQSVNFLDFGCSVEFLKSPFLVQQWQFLDKAGVQKERLRLDRIQESLSKKKPRDADIIIFNTGHWWTHQNTHRGENYFQEGGHVFKSMRVADAYAKALMTWAQWVDANINSNHTRVFFRGYSASHFKGGQWNSGGSCEGEREAMKKESQLGGYPWMMRVVERVIGGMKTPVLYLNISRMTEYRKDGHPSIFRPARMKKMTKAHEDCSHWCLPGVPDSWNELLYATLLLHPLPP